MHSDSPRNRDVYSVSRLNSEARAVLEGSFPLLWVEGEISNLAAPRSGHLYFTLKDPHAQVRCALFRGKRQLLRFKPKHGDQVLARVRISFYEPRGEFQLIVEHLEPAGAGSAQRAFDALKQKLAQEGLFDQAGKQELPTFPRRLGVITSPSGAAIRDVLNVLRRRAPALAVTIFPAQVQGSGAVDELLAALKVALQRRDCDVLLLTRGGGSIEDMAAFNDERLARAIAAAEIPIVSAVGHEIDFTIADFVADRRAPTPSAAAELISPDSAALQRGIAQQRERLGAALRRRIGQDRQQLVRLQGRLQRAAPASRLRQQQQRLDNLDTRLLRATHTALSQRRNASNGLLRRLQALSPERRLQTLERRLETLPQRFLLAWQRSGRRRLERLDALARQLHAISPLATMQRGYAVLRHPSDLVVVNSVAQIAPGDALEALLPDGRAQVQVTDVERANSDDS